MRGKIKEAREAAKLVSVEVIGEHKLPDDFEAMLKVYEIAVDIQQIALLDKKADRLFTKLNNSLKKGTKALAKRHVQSWLQQLLSAKYAKTKTVKENIDILTKWHEEVTQVSAKPKANNGGYSYWKLESKKVVNRRIMSHFHAPVSTPMEDHYTVHYDFSNKGQSKDWEKHRYLNDRMSERAFNLGEEIAAFSSKKPWEISGNHLWGKGMDRWRLRAPIVKGYLRVEIEAMPFNHNNLIVDLGLHGDGGDAGYLPSNVHSSSSIRTTQEQPHDGSVECRS